MRPARQAWERGPPLFGLHGVSSSCEPGRLATGAGGQQGLSDVAFLAIPDHGQVVGIVEDQQPASVRPAGVWALNRNLPSGHPFLEDGTVSPERQNPRRFPDCWPAPTECTGRASRWR